jgi:hypothetical protein
MLDRMPDFWQGIIGSETPRQIVIVSSGVDRAMDSEGFFVRSLTTRQPALAKFVTKEPAPAGYPEGNPKVQPVGTNRFVLYFHKLVPERDLVTNPKDRYLQTYRDSQSYQEYLKGGDYKAKHAAVLADPAGKAAGRAVLERLFKKPFVDAIDAGTYTFANTGSFAFTSDDGKYAAKVKGDGKTKIKSLADAGLYIYQLYAAAPAIKAESGVDLTPYLAAESSDYFAQAEDGLSFYRMGPGITEKGDITWKMAQILQDDFFAEVDAIAGGRMKHGAKLRFAHAEIVVPFASKLGLKNVLAQVPLAAMFSYPSNPWRGNYVAPMASNLQWDVYSDGKGTLLVKMLFNERETNFKAECDGAKVAPDSRYYDYRKLRACYGYKPLS